MENRRPVVAAIPAYNAEHTLKFLVDEVLNQEYDQVFVMDDASRDGTVELAQSYGSDVTIIAGKENIGPGGNRNRVIPALGSRSIIHFLDSDVRLNSKDSPQIARELASYALVGFSGGLVRNPNGLQNPYNFGPRPSAINDLTAGVQYLLWTKQNPKLDKAARKVLPSLRKWPNITEEPQRKEVFWVSEANMVVDSEVFERLGCYDPQFRYSEIFDLAIKNAHRGYKVVFDPLLDVTHKTYDTAGEKSGGRMEAAKQLRKKYGFLQWLLGQKITEDFNF